MPEQCSMFRPAHPTEGPGNAYDAVSSGEWDRATFQFWCDKFVEQAKALPPRMFYDMMRPQ